MESRSCDICGVPETGSVDLARRRWFGFGLDRIRSARLCPDHLRSVETVSERFFTTRTWRNRPILSRERCDECGVAVRMDRSYTFLLHERLVRCVRYQSKDIIESGKLMQVYFQIRHVFEWVLDRHYRNIYLTGHLCEPCGRSLDSLITKALGPS